MSNNPTLLRSPLGKAKGSGAAGHGASHWLHQRITAVALVPLFIWFVVTVMRIVQGDSTDLQMILTSPLNGILLVTMMLVTLYHGMIGMQVIIEDYVHHCCFKATLMLLMYFITGLTAVTGLYVIFLFQFSLINAV